MAKLSDDEVRRLHERWCLRQHIRYGSGHYQDAWYSEQCFSCRFFLVFSHSIGEDWGVCANGASPRDGLVTFEHDGCEGYDVDPRYETPD
jgi:hypothetical protein